MQSSRDSSVWRSLAVAFGDGLAFGVGVKLSQTAAARARSAEVREPDPGPLAARLEMMERRMAEMEKAPAALPAPVLDQKVIEAVVQAVEGRLKEHSAQVEGRLAELLGMVTMELRALRQQDQTIASAVEAHIEELQDHFIAQVETLRGQVEQDRAALEQQVTEAAHIAAEALAAAANGNEIADLRQRLEDSDQAMLDLLNGIGDLMRQGAARKAPPTAPTPAPDVPAESAQAPEPPLVVNGAAHATAAAVDQPVPSFADPARPARLWRVPLVSSMVIATFGLVALHYF